jgi:FixJ family two-component response regulator
MSNKKYPLVFIVEDNKAYSKGIVHYLKVNNFDNVKIFISGEECLKNLYLKPDIIIQDYKLQGMSGLNVLQRTKKVLPGTEFIFLSAQENIDIAVNTLKYGAFDYIIKNELAFQKVLEKIESIIDAQQQRRYKHKRRLFYIFLIIIVIGIALLLWLKK